MSPGWIQAVLNKLGQDGPPLCVGYSGGGDSTALLHLLAHSPALRQRGLRALHIDHGLHPASADWATAALAFCASLAIPCQVVAVRVDPDTGLGLEGAAREARYQAFAAHLHDHEWLLLAQHRDDQAETVLLKLLRGAGPDALRGMREQRPLGAGQLLRPLLAVPQQQLRDYVHAHALPVQHDPSNQDPSLARNYLRREVMPRLQNYWPQAIDSILHSARWCGEAMDALQPQIEIALHQLHQPADASLDANGWLALPDAIRVAVLHQWLRQRDLPVPSTRQRQQLEQQISAQPGKLPQVSWPGAVVHVWRQRLWASLPPLALPSPWQRAWAGESIQLPDGSHFELVGASTALPPLQLRLRQGGERLQLAGETIHRELRDLFQQGGLPPWRRPSCPLVFEDGQLIAVADRWLSARGRELLQTDGARLRWSDTSGH